LTFVGLLLAAGSASRFGSDKLQHPLPHGVAIAVQSARHLQAAVSRVVAVVRPGAQETARALAAEGCEVAVCEQAATGMGASLACAVRAAGAAEGYLVALGDMPFVRPSTIAAVRDALAGGALLAAPYWRARRGHPVGFAGSLRAELEALSGDEGRSACSPRTRRSSSRFPSATLARSATSTGPPTSPRRSPCSRRAFG
jgi:molybdenum cofactor cytidylyltransferase